MEYNLLYKTPRSIICKHEFKEPIQAPIPGKLKQAGEILGKELASERQSKKQLEEDAARHRTDLKGQIEKLRANMHSLLQDKGRAAR